MISETEIISALSSRAEEFTLKVWPDSRPDPDKNCLWVNDTLQVFTGGLRTGRWVDADGNSGDLLELYAEAAGFDRGVAVQRCAGILGLSNGAEDPVQHFEEQVDEPAPVSIPPEEREEPPKRERVLDRQRGPGGDLPRAIPFAQDAERGLIGSLLHDPIGVLTLCEERGVVPGYFFDHACAIIYQVIAGSKGEPMDLLPQK